MKLLEGKVALITGASKGIGRKIAEKFVEQGAQVAFTYLSSVEKGEALEKELQTGSAKVKGYRSDASNFAEAEKLIEAIVADFGTLDIVVNNAGITKDGLLMRMTEENWDDVLNINLKSIFNITKAASKIMMKNRQGVFVNMSSVVGVQGNAGQANYAASKAGIIGFSKSIAKELGSPRSSNIVMLGAASPHIDLPYEALEDAIREIFMRKGEKVVEANIAALRAGREFSKNSKAIH